MYGLDDEVTRNFGMRCLIARRLVERGVRFVQVISGSGDSKDWDHHDDSHKGTLRQARKVDQPIAALLQDLAARGLLGPDADRLVGRVRPHADFARGQGTRSQPEWVHHVDGRRRHRRGQIIGATDEIGLRAVEDKVHMHDAHATILSLLGLDHRKLTYLFQGASSG